MIQECEVLRFLVPQFEQMMAPWGRGGGGRGGGGGGGRRRGGGGVGEGHWVFSLLQSSHY